MIKRMRLADIKYSFSEYSKLSKEEKLGVKSLSLRSEGAFCSDMVIHGNLAKILIAKAENKIIGWCVTFIGYHDNLITYVYVRKTHRRLGIGTDLLGRMKKLYCIGEVFDHDPVSNKFYRNVKKMKQFNEIAVVRCY